ncbi:NAD-dependent epimerase/dehydratase family protein [Telmatocola sphagniphila]|uniref:NAD-dependent epimerase/dehydratase family protein n=1 Tax=Telmatocola sphagniphila TaxID=1123043 RepID=A0A8E6B7K2_9BACT|nr:NAD-dependent epimerase/dehydratase family protein [Telmatocola sphagniphila]QVL33357.1 NAD-dependent epimerase/dehydratase family protein [Telmatocola sphagniphila]
MKTALVTGGGGFLGRSIVRLLIDRGYHVRSFSRTNSGHIQSPSVEICLGDLVDPEAIERAGHGCDVIYHVAAKAGIWGSYRDYFSANVIGTRHVLSACRKNQVRRLVYTSTPSVVYPGGDLEEVNESIPYPRRFEAPYAETKAIAEQEVLAANYGDLSTVALRPHLIWGPGDPHLIPRIVTRARKGKLACIGSGNNKVDVIFVENAALAHILAGESLASASPQAGKAYFLSQGEPVKLWDFINQILAIYNVPPVTRRIPTSVAYSIGWMMEGLYRLFPILGEPPMTRFVARNLSTAHWFDISAAKRDFGYSPMISTAEGLERLRESLATHPS